MLTNETNEVSSSLNPQKWSLNQGSFRIETNDFQNVKNDYEWRSTTQSPIIKTTSLKITHESPEYIDFKVQIEPIQAKLSFFTQLALPKIIYLLKEVLVGYERLSSKYGKFRLTTNMIGIDNNFRCKIWINTDFSSNTPEFKDPSYTFFDILSMLQALCATKKITECFFAMLRQTTNILSCLKAICSFTSFHRMIVPKKFYIKQFELSGSMLSFTSFSPTCSSKTNKNSNSKTKYTSTNNSPAPSNEQLSPTFTTLMRLHNANRLMELQTVKSGGHLGATTEIKDKKEAERKPVQTQQSQYQPKVERNWLNNVVDLEGACVTTSMHLGKEMKMDYSNTKLDLLNQCVAKECMSDADSYQDKEIIRQSMQYFMEEQRPDPINIEMEQHIESKQHHLQQE